MTVPSTASEISYATDGVTVNFTIPFAFDTSADIVAKLTDSSGNIAPFTAFSVTGGNGSTGTLTTNSVLAGGKVLTIIDDPSRSQNTDYVPNGPFSATAHERALDKLTRLVKRLHQRFERAVRTDDGDPASGSAMVFPTVPARRGKYAFWADSTTAQLEPAVAVATNPLSQSVIGTLLYPPTVAEGVSVVNPGYRYGHVRRYGNTLNSATLQAALNANAGGAIYLSAGETHTVTTALTVPANTDILVDGEGTAIIDASTATLSAPGLIVSQGTISGSLGGGLAAGITKGDLSFAFNNSSHNLAAGDLIAIHNTTAASWNASDANSHQGEFQVVKSVSGVTVGLASAALDTYSSSCVVYKITPTTTKIEGKITIIGNPSDTVNAATVYLKYGRGTRVSGLSFRNTTATCIEHSSCYMPSVYNIESGKYVADSGSIEATGLIFAGCQYASCRDSVLIASRHGGSTGGSGLVVDRFNVFEHCFLASRSARAADFHGSAEFCAYISCHVDGGVIIAGARNRVIDCDIYPHATATNLVFLELVKSIEHIIERNRFYVQGSVVANVVDASAATCINGTHTVEDGVLIFRDNEIIDTTSSSHAYINLRNNGSTTSMHIEVTGNTVRKTNTSTFGNLLSVAIVTGSNFKRIAYRDNTHIGNVGFGVVANVDTLNVNGECGWGDTNSSSPSFGSAFFEPSEFSFEKVIDIGTAATAFGIFNVATGNSFVPDTVSARANVNITATTGNFMAIGVDASNRRADFGVSAAAVSSQFVKNTKIRFINSSERTNQMVDAGEGLSLMSVDVNTDGAVLASNIGGASQSVNVRISGRMVGNLVSVP